MRNVLDDPKKPRADAPITVTQLTAQLRGTLERAFPSVWVEGEVSGWTVAASGHAYFTLKDEGAALACVCWRGTRAGLSFAPRDGQRVECRGAISVFEKRGSYQLTVSAMRPAGEGELYRRFLELKGKLEREGLFDPGRKRPLPEFPRAVGIVTSASGAVLHDIRNVAGRRAPWMPLLLWPSRVQGEGAGRELAHAVERLGASGLVDAIIVGRGGGSMEDLWEFNTEALARAVAACPVPVLSAVGHETDFTICDFAADLRAPTPSAAAELVTAGHFAVRERILRAVRSLEREVPERIARERRAVESLLRSYEFRRAEVALRDAMQRTDDALRTLPLALERRIGRTRDRIAALSAALAGHDPELILKKGYAIVRESRSGAVVRDPAALKPAAIVEAQVSGGTFRAAVIGEAGQRDLFG